MMLTTLLLIPFTLIVAANLKNGQVNFKQRKPIFAALTQRELQLDGIQNLKSLNRNANLAKASCKTWTAIFCIFVFVP
jgi:hypothetical protein